MPPVQKTFSIIPQGPSLAAGAGAGQPAIRPMTSKQVRKAYKAANKGPSMSRAERIKWERAEQERIRKEFEKEKAAVKAKAARERKKEKELAQREQKRRNGLPLVSVRPSQDTIARFVRGNGSGKKRDSTGLEIGEKPARQLSAIEEVMEEERELDEERVSEYELDEPNQAFMDPLQATVLEHSPVSKDGSVKPRTQDLSMESQKGGCRGQDDDKLTTYDIVEERPRDLYSGTPDSLSPDATEDDTLLDAKSTAATTQVVNAAATTIQRNHPGKKTLPEVDLITEWDDFELDMLAIEAMTQQKQPGQLSESLDSTNSNDRYCKPAPEVSIKKDLGIDMTSVLDLSRLDPPPAKPPDQEDSIRPPPLPMPQPSPRSQSVSVDEQPQLPPLSTQAIFSNVDEFFPTASQLELELELEEDTQLISRKSTPLPDPRLSPLANHQPPCHTSKLPSPGDQPESPNFKKHLHKPFDDEKTRSATSHRSPGNASFQTRRDREPVREKAEMMSQAPQADKPKEAFPNPRLMSRPNQPKKLLYLAEKKLAAIRQANIHPRPSPKNTKAAQKRPLKPMTKHQSPKVLAKTPPVYSSSISQRRPPPPKTSPTSCNTSEKISHPPTVLTSTTNKENMAPPTDQTEMSKCLPTASQESYGGDWVDEAALELMM